jgi:hypothetical protein
MFSMGGLLSRPRKYAEVVVFQLHCTFPCCSGDAARFEGGEDGGDRRWAKQRGSARSRCSEHGPIFHLFELILVIHVNTSNGTNHFVEHVFVGIYRSHGCYHMLTYHAQVNMSYHKLTYHGHLRLLTAKMDILGYKWWHVKYVKDVKLKQRSKLKTRRKGRKKTPSDEPTVPSVHSVGVVGTLRRRQNKVGTIGWTDGPFCRCAGWIAEEEQRIQ